VRFTWLGHDTDSYGIYIFIYFPSAKAARECSLGIKNKMGEKICSGKKKLKGVNVFVQNKMGSFVLSFASQDFLFYCKSPNEKLIACIIEHIIYKETLN
jgi:hypothetical protein